MKQKKPEFNSLIELMDNFPTERECLEHFEQMRWPDGEPVCIHCGSVKVYRLKNFKLFKCGDCRKQFSAKVGTIFEESPVPMRKWFMAIFLVTSSKKGIASLQLSRSIHVTQKTAWFMLHRIRFMMSQNKDTAKLCEVVEADEMFIGGKPKKGDKKRDADGNKLRKSGAGTKKPIVFGMVERGGRVIAKPVADRNAQTLQALIKLNIEQGTTLITDEYNSYRGLGSDFEHKKINHSLGEYSDKAGTHTNTIEGFWGLMKRGFIGVYHKMSPKHLDLYCDEFTFRYSTRLASEEARFNRSLTQSEGRITFDDLKRKKPIRPSIVDETIG